MGAVLQLAPAPGLRRARSTRTAITEDGHVTVAPRRVSPVRLTARGQRLVAAAVVVVLAFCAVMLVGSLVSGAVSSPGYEHTAVVRVSAGEDLLTVARQTNPHTDPATVISAIAELNGLSGRSDVTAGKQLLVPVFDR